MIAPAWLGNLTGNRSKHRGSPPAEIEGLEQNSIVQEVHDVGTDGRRKETHRARNRRTREFGRQKTELLHQRVNRPGLRESDSLDREMLALNQFIAGIVLKQKVGIIKLFPDRKEICHRTINGPMVGPRLLRGHGVHMDSQEGVPFVAELTSARGITGFVRSISDIGVEVGGTWHILRKASGCKTIASLIEGDRGAFRMLVRYRKYRSNQISNSQERARLTALGPKEGWQF